MTNEIKKNVYGYIRVSTEKQVKTGQGLEIQKRDIQKYCDENNLNLLGFFSDDGISGAAVEVTDRKGFMDMVDACQEANKKFNKKKYTQTEWENFFNVPNEYIYAVVYQKTDRIARDAPKYFFAEKELTKAGVKMLSVEEDMFNNSNDPVIVAMKQMMVVFAEMEKKIIVSRMQKGIAKRAEQGYKPCGRLPYGYKYSDNQNNKQAVIVPEEAKVVNTIFQMAAQNYSLQKIADTLNYKGIKTKSNKPWRKQSIKIILDNDFYISILTYKQKIKGNHPAIISDELWNKVHNKAA